MKTLLLTVALAGMASPALAENLRRGRCSLPTFSGALATIASLVATPSAVTFAATNPEGGAVAGSTAATIDWSVEGGSHLQTWTVSVQAEASTFTNCPTVPVSAITVSCASATVGGGSGTGSCSGSSTLTTVAQQVAGGAQGDGTQSYSVVANYTLAESWRYVAASACTLTVTYTVNAL